MKNILLLASLFLTLSSQAQFGNLVKKVSGKDSGSKVSVPGILSKSSSSSLSNSDIISGLREALNKGTDMATQRLSSPDGFFKDAAVKILMPEEAKKVESRLRSMGMGKQVDDAILSMNRAAEDAASGASQIFLNAIKGMTIGDGMSILRGGDLAATNYLKEKTTLELTEKFRPVIEASLQKVGATKYWNTLFSTYNKFSAQKVNPDLSAYVTEKALTGIFLQIGQEESKIRKDPGARTSEILKKVFGSQK